MTKDKYAERWLALDMLSISRPDRQGRFEWEPTSNRSSDGDRKSREASRLVPFRHTRRMLSNRHIFQKGKNMTKIRPMGDRIVVTPIDGKAELQKQYNAVVIPETSTMARELEYRLGRVIAISPDIVDPESSPGDVVLYRKFTGIETTIGGEEIVILTLDETLAQVTDCGE